jgi:hypothetical protein
VDRLAEKEGRRVTDLMQEVVRDAGLATGLMDYKICSIDERWSGLRFTRRKMMKGRQWKRFKG